MRRVLVTGASGFVGRHLVGSLAKDGWTVRAASRDPNSVSFAGGIESVALPDLTRKVDWTALLDGVTHVVHLAGIAHAPGTLPDALYQRVNADAVGELAHAAEGKVERLVLISSVRAQVGLSSEHIIKESDAPHPTDAYGRTKLMAEKLLQESSVAWCVLRPAVVYGPGVKGNIAALATLAKTPMPLPFGKLDNKRSLLAIENLASAIALVLTSPEAAGEIFLVADPEAISVADLVSALREGLGRAPNLAPIPAGAVKRIMATFGKEAEWERLSGSFVIDVSKLLGIGWTPELRTRDGLAQMMRSETAKGAEPR